MQTSNPSPAPPFSLTDPPEKCLSINEPWAYLIAAGWKTVENRTWHTNYRGRILIHASSAKRHMTAESEEFICAAHPGIEKSLMRDNRLPRDSEFATFNFGYAIGTAELVGCVNFTREVESLSDFAHVVREAGHGDWLDKQLARHAAGEIPHPEYFASGIECWLFDNPIQFARPFPMSGKLNLFRLDAEQLALAAAALRTPGDPVEIALSAAAAKSAVKTAMRAAKQK